MDRSPYKAIMRLLKLGFLYPTDTKTRVKHVILSAFLITPIMVGSNGYLYQSISAGYPEYAFHDGYYLCFFYTMVQFIYVYSHVGDRLWAVMKRINSDIFEIPEALTKWNKNLDQATWILSFTSMVIDVTQSFYYTRTEKFCGLRHVLNDTRYRCGFRTSVWYAFDQNEYVKDWILILWSIIAQALILTTYGTTEYVFLAFLRTVSIRLQHLRSKVEAFNETNPQKFTKNIKYFAEYYTEIRWYIDEFNHTIGYMLSPCYSSGVVLISWLAFLIFSKARAENGALLAVYVFFATVCYIGQNWEDEHEKLVHSVRNIRWYRVPPKTRKDYAILLGNVERPVHLYGQPFVRINNQLLLLVTRHCYNILMFMAQMMD